MSIGEVWDETSLALTDVFPHFKVKGIKLNIEEVDHPLTILEMQ